MVWVTLGRKICAADGVWWKVWLPSTTMVSSLSASTVPFRLPAWEILRNLVGVVSFADGQLFAKLIVFPRTTHARTIYRPHISAIESAGVAAGWCLIG